MRNFLLTLTAGFLAGEAIAFYHTYLIKRLERETHSDRSY